MMKKTIFVSFILLILLISGCTQPPANDETGNGTVIITEPTYGTLNLSITDAPIEGLKVLNVTISGIEVHSGDGEWIAFSDEEQTFNLMQLQGVSEVLGEKELETGLYTQIRLSIISADLELEDGTTAEVIVPSDKVKIVRNFAITEDAETEMIIDFKPESVKVANDKYMMTPVLKLLNSAEFQEHIDAIEETEGTEEEEQEGTEETEEESEEDNQDPEGTTGNLAVYITDKVTDEVETLNITFDSLDAHKTGGKWFVISDAEHTFDLLQLTDVQELFGENEVETGHYTMLRLNIVKATITLKETDGENGTEGEEIEVTVPSEKLRFNHQFYIGEGETTELLIDFIVEKSLIKTGNGEWKLKPVVKIITQKGPEEPEELCGNSEVDEGEDCETCAEDVLCEEGFECVNAECVEITLCGNAEINEGEDCENCAEDVTCPEGTECAEGTCTEINLCGNDTIDEGEDCSTCADDVVCAAGTECSEGVCVEGEVTIYTDKTEYTEGETVQITFENNTSENVKYLEGCIDTFNPYLKVGEEFEVRILALMYCMAVPEFTTLPAGESVNFEWNQEIAYEGDPDWVVGRVLGIYKISIKYFAEEESMQDEGTRIFSDELELI